MTRSGTEAGWLEGGTVLGAVRRASRALSAAEDPEDALQALVDALVPELADAAVLYVVGNDGRLHARTGAGPPDAGSTSAAPGPLERESDHPAALAWREGELVVLLEGREGPEVWRGEERGGGSSLRSMANTISRRARNHQC